MSHMTEVVCVCLAVKYFQIFPVISHLSDIQDLDMTSLLATNQREHEQILSYGFAQSAVGHHCLVIVNAVTLKYTSSMILHC